MSIENGPREFNHSKEDYIWSLETVMPQLRAFVEKTESEMTQDELDGLIEGLDRVDLYKSGIIQGALDHIRFLKFGIPEEAPRNLTFEECIHMLRIALDLTEDEAKKLVGEAEAYKEYT